MGTLKTTNIQTITGSGTLTLGTSGETLVLGSGVTNNLNYPMFQAHLSSNQSLPNNVGTKVTLDVVDFDTASCWDATNYRWTPNVAGKYLIYRNIVLDNSAGVYFMESHIFKNGTHITTGRNTSVIENASNTDQTFESLAQSGTCIVDMNGSSDYLELFGYIYNNGTGSIRGDRRSLMGAYRIGT